MIKNFDGNIFIDKLSKVDKEVEIFPNVYILGNCEIKKGTKIYPNSILIDAKIGENCEIKSSYIESSVIKDNVKIGPFAHIRPNSLIKNDCKIGNFVEIKNSVIGANTKASHLAYIGDSEIGDNCNIGCGVIFANYDGKTKHKAIVGDGCFVGSNSNIIAPIVIAKNTYICAGTTLTKDTKEGDFVIARLRETIKQGRAYKYFGDK